MDNYKIKVKDEASADEARDLFKKLGYHPDNSSYEPYVGWVAVFEDGSGSFYSHNMNLNDCVEITIAQLRDLVVLKRNDINDATHTCENDFKYICIDERWNLMTTDGWFHVSVNPKALKPIKKHLETVTGRFDENGEHHLTFSNGTEEKDPALISGADVPRLIKEGNQIQLRAAIGFKLGEWKDLDLERDEEELTLGDLINSRFEWRLKPQTIKVELELPKPFEPKLGDIYWFISPFYSTGYDHCTFTNDSADKLHVQYGVYRSEDDVKKAVEQLRKIRGAS